MATNQGLSLTMPGVRATLSWLKSGKVNSTSRDVLATEFHPSPWHQAIGLIGFVAVCFGAAGVGGAITSTSVTSWYQTLAKPSWTPPDWLFGPVWTLLYFVMAVAAWLVWRRSGWSSDRMPLALFGLQLTLNVLWSGVFFGFRSPGWAFVEILGLWLTIYTTALAFRPFSRAAAWMMVPYLAWTTFAACLNFQIWRLNG